MKLVQVAVCETHPDTLVGVVLLTMDEYHDTGMTMIDGADLAAFEEGIALLYPENGDRP